MLAIFSPQQIVPLSLRLYPVAHESFQNFCIRLHHLLTQMDQALEASHTGNWSMKLAQEFLSSLWGPTGKWTELSDTEALHPPSTHPQLYLNLRSPLDRAQMMSRKQLNKESFYQTVLHFLQYPTATEESPDYYIVSNLNEWYVFTPRDLQRVFDRPQLREYAQEWTAGNPAFASRQHLYRLIDACVTDNLSPLTATYFTLYGASQLLEAAEEVQLLPIFQFLSPHHLWQTPLPALPGINPFLQQALSLLGVTYKGLEGYQYLRPIQGEAALTEAPQRFREAIAEKWRDQVLACLSLPVLSKGKSTSLPELQALFQDVYLLPQAHLHIYADTKVPWPLTELLHVYFQLLRNPTDAPLVPTTTLDHWARELLTTVLTDRFHRDLGTTDTHWSACVAEVLQLPKDEVRPIFSSLKLLDPWAGTGQFFMALLRQALLIEWELGLLPLSEEDTEITLQWHQEQLVLLDLQGNFLPPDSQSYTRMQAVLKKALRSFAQRNLYGVCLRASQRACIELRVQLALWQMGHPLPAKLPNLKLNLVVADAVFSQWPRETDATQGFENPDQLPEARLDHMDRHRERITQLERVYHKEFGGLSLIPIQETPEQAARKAQLVEEIQSLKAQLSQPEAHPLWEWKKAFPHMWNDSSGGFDAGVSIFPLYKNDHINRYRPFLKEKYKSYHLNAGYYLYAFELGIRLLKPGGRFMFWSPDSWQKAQYGRPLREWLPSYAYVQFESPEVFLRRNAKHNLLVSGYRLMPSEKLGILSYK